MTTAQDIADIKADVRAIRDGALFVRQDVYHAEQLSVAQSVEGLKERLDNLGASFRAMTTTIIGAVLSGAGVYIVRAISQGHL